MALKPTAFLDNRNAVIGTSLGTPGASDYPQSSSYMYWPTGITNTWPSGDLSNYNRHKQMWQAKGGVAKPGVVTWYLQKADMTATTGITGSAGAYGLVTPDMRDIANDGCILWLSFQWGGAAAWQTTANNLNAAGDNADKQGVRTAVQNIRRWIADTGNTATVKKLLLNIHHEPSNDAGGTAAQYVAFYRAMVTYFARRGIGDNPALVALDGASAPGGAATWLGGVEWSFCDIADTFRVNGNDDPYWPGDDYVTWASIDPYNWGGGQTPAVCDDGGVAQPGDDCKSSTGSNNYTKSWVPLGKIAGVIAFLNWAAAHPTIRLGIREFSCSEYVDQWNVTGTTINSTKKFDALPLAKGDWFRQAARFFRGDTPSTDALSVNGGWTNPGAWGRKFQMIAFWNSQAASPRWFNTIPYAKGDVTTPSTTGTTKTASFDGFLAMVNDPWFAVTPTFVPPTLGGITKSGTALAATFVVSCTPGDGSLVKYDWDFGDGATSTDTGGTSSVSYVGEDHANGTGTTVTIPVPAGAVAGDTLVVAINTNGATSVTAPGGWTTDYSGPGTLTNPCGWVGHYVLPAGTPPANFSWTLGSSVGWNGDAMAFRSVDGTTPLDVAVSTVEQTSASSTITIPGVTTAHANTALVYAVGNNTTGNTWTPPSGYTEVYDPGISKGMSCGYKLWSGSGATGSVAAVASGSAKGWGVLIALRPATVTVGSTSTRSHTYAANGTYNVQCVVTDSNGSTDVANLTVTVATGTPPTLGSITATADVTGLGVTLSVGGTAGGSASLTGYSWDFGDSVIAQTTGTATSTVTHPYAGSGTYVVTVTVTQSDGLTAQAQLTVSVTEATVDGGVAPYSLAPLMSSGDPIEDLRYTFNPAVLALDAFARNRARETVLDNSTATWAVPAALTVYRGDNWRRYWTDLTNFTEIKLKSTQGTAALAGTKLGLAYSTDGGTTWRWIDGAGPSGALVSTTLPAGACQITLLASANPVDGTYVTLPDDAQQNVQLRLYGINGNGTTAPLIQQVVAVMR